MFIFPDGFFVCGEHQMGVRCVLLMKQDLILPFVQDHRYI